MLAPGAERDGTEAELSEADEQPAIDGETSSETEAVEMTPFEFHFQEIFSGQRIDLSTGDVVRAEIVAQTRFQTGLAHIERLELADGEEVKLRIDEEDLEVTVRVDSGRPFVRVNLIDGNLQVESLTTSPGYL